LEDKPQVFEDAKGLAAPSVRHLPEPVATRQVQTATFAWPRLAS
jgi:hypothetical protein